jgi:hypothetical protein
MENHTRVSHPSHNSLGISQTPRDSHIPTAAATVPLSQTQNQNQNQRKEVGRCAASSSSQFHDHPALESETAFMIIRGLENASRSCLIALGVFKWKRSSRLVGRFFLTAYELKPVQEEVTLVRYESDTVFVNFLG